MTNYTNTYTSACRTRHIIKTSDTVLKKIYISLYWKGCVWEGELETEQNCNILTLTLLAITAFLSCSPRLLNWGPRLSGTYSSIQHILTNWSDLQTDWISCALSYIIVQCPPSSCGRYKLHSFNLSTVKVIISWSTECTCYLYRCISYFDSPAGS